MRLFEINLIFVKINSLYAPITDHPGMHDTIQITGKSLHPVQKLERTNCTRRKQKKRWEIHA